MLDKRLATAIIATTPVKAGVKETNKRSLLAVFAKVGEIAYPEQWAQDNK